MKAALFNNTPSPDATAAVASTGYNTGVWITANEVTGGGGWVAGGIALGTKAWAITAAGTQSTPAVTSFTAANTAGAGPSTVTATFGTLVYDGTITAGTVAAQGMCFNYFGGTQSVTAGTFTIVWDATGVFKVTT